MICRLTVGIFSSENSKVITWRSHRPLLKRLMGLDKKLGQLESEDSIARATGLSQEGKKWFKNAKLVSHLSQIGDT
jgi:hypothetical protein